MQGSEASLVTQVHIHIHPVKTIWYKASVHPTRYNKRFTISLTLPTACQLVTSSCNRLPASDLYSHLHLDSSPAAQKKKGLEHEEAFQTIGQGDIGVKRMSALCIVIWVLLSFNCSNGNCQFVFLPVAFVVLFKIFTAWPPASAASTAALAPTWQCLTNWESVVAIKFTFCKA